MYAVSFLFKWKVLLVASATTEIFKTMGLVEYGKPQEEVLDTQSCYELQTEAKQRFGVHAYRKLLQMKW